ncbi:hypothetical protein HN51_027071 [Arachis hypogaea]
MQKFQLMPSLSEWIEVRKRNIRHQQGPVQARQHERYGINGNEDRNRKALENFRRLEEGSFTVFVDNLKETTIIHWLWDIFSREGYVVDVFLSQKIRTNTKYRFAFVKYTYQNHAEREIQNMDGWIVNGSQLSVKEAKYRRKGIVEERKNRYRNGDAQQEKGILG